MRWLGWAVALGLFSGGWGGGGRVLLRDVKVLTLYEGRQTAGRRSSPVAQLKCVGGTAAGKLLPNVVQCYNRGFDGQDVQWECKTDMDNEFRFGNIRVSCEGYDYPDDPYVLQGSCGLEYELDYTKRGWDQRQQADLELVVVAFFAFIFVLLIALIFVCKTCKMCVRTAKRLRQRDGGRGYQDGRDSFYWCGDDSDGGGSDGGCPGTPPPPGFRDYAKFGRGAEHQGPKADARSSRRRRPTPAESTKASGSGRRAAASSAAPSAGTWASAWATTTTAGSGGGGWGGGGSSGSRTASGFGGTTRR